jgi:hypothetical protein
MNLKGLNRFSPVKEKEKAGSAGFRGFPDYQGVTGFTLDDKGFFQLFRPCRDHHDRKLVYHHYRKVATVASAERGTAILMGMLGSLVILARDNPGIRSCKVTIATGRQCQGDHVNRKKKGKYPL